jgi:DNA polymerase-3 subunit beta
MKFKVASPDLQKVLSKIAGVVPAKSTLPILENILFDLTKDKLTVTATDLEISMAATIAVVGTNSGKIAVPARRILETTRALSETEIVFDADESNKITMTTDMGEYKMMGESSEEFPSIPQFKGEMEFEVESGLLHDIINKTIFSVSTDDLRPSMMGVLFQIKKDEFRAVATDGHRLVRIINTNLKTSGKERDIIIPSKALNLVLKSIDEAITKISVNETHVKFDFGNTVLISRLIDETYPNYESVIPLENDKKLTVNRNAILSSVRRVSLYSNATTHQIRFGLSSKQVKISAEDIDIGGEAKEMIPCNYDADAMEIGFNSRYVVDVLTHMDTEDVVFSFNSPTRASIVHPSEQKNGENVLMLVMPVRLNN